MVGGTSAGGLPATFDGTSGRGDLLVGRLGAGALLTTGTSGTLLAGTTGTEGPRVLAGKDGRAGACLMNGLSRGTAASAGASIVPVPRSNAARAMPPRIADVLVMIILLKVITGCPAVPRRCSIVIGIEVTAVT